MELLRCKSSSQFFRKNNTATDFVSTVRLKGRFLLFQVYCYFANLFFKLSISTFYKEISKSQQKVQMRDSLTLLRTPVSAIFSFAPKIDNTAIAMLQCIFG